jgi:glyoxalase family protein
MSLATSGLHHITAIASDLGRNADFYTRVLGLCLVKRTVNLEARDVYHLYYGDAAGHPGTIVTFFVRRNGPTGRIGDRQATRIRFGVPPASLAWWQRRLVDSEVDASDEPVWCGAPALSFADPDGLPLQLVGVSDPVADRSAGAARSPHEIRGLHSVELLVPDPDATVALFTDLLGFSEALARRPWRRLIAAGSGPGVFVDVRAAAGMSSGAMGAGCIHHVAVRAQTDHDQIVWQDRLRRSGLDVTDIKDRSYFRSIYFHEPNGIRCEIATDAPGFAIDESPDELGRRLQLPSSLEPARQTLEAGLAGLLPSPT